VSGRRLTIPVRTRKIRSVERQKEVSFIRGLGLYVVIRQNSFEHLFMLDR
jgi:hypothetical protein